MNDCCIVDMEASSTNTQDLILKCTLETKRLVTVCECLHFTQRRGQQAGLLFVCQTDWQQRLLRRYGSVCLLDATYRTTRYALPLFFLCVRTNVDYVVVATFVTQSEDSASIAEAVQMIRSWNPEWTPQSFMVDFCEAEINALGSVFPGTHALYSLSYLLSYLSM